MNAEMIFHVYKHVIPAAMDLLPGRMDSIEARAMLIAIGLQESRFKHRVQVPNGPAHGFWQFEKGGGTKEVLTNVVTRPLLEPVLQVLNYPAKVPECYTAIIHNDVLACVFARLFLWTVPGALPKMTEPNKGWNQYLGKWAPGKPHPETWDVFYAEAWRTVTQE